MALVPSAGGAQLPYQKQEFKTDVKIGGNLVVTGTVTGSGTGGAFASPAITGTVTGGASYTAPTLTSPTITGTTAIGAGATLTSPTLVTPVIGVATGTSLAVSGLVTSTSPSAGIGYATGAGGTGTQGTDKTTTVVLSPTACLSGAVTVNAATLNAATVVTFSVTNTSVAATDVIVVNHISGGTLGAYTVNAHAAAGSFAVNLRNNTAGNLSEALVLQFAVIKAVNS